MVNIKKRDFYNAITGDETDGKDYGVDASTFRRVDNVNMVFSSRGEYLGIQTCRGKIVDGKYIAKQGPSDFKSFQDLKIWAGKGCRNEFFIETKDGTFVQIDRQKI